MFRHPRNIIRDPEEVDRLEEQAEKATLMLFRGDITQDEYFKYLNEMREYLDFRRLAAVVSPIDDKASIRSINFNHNGNKKSRE